MNTCLLIDLIIPGIKNIGGNIFYWRKKCRVQESVSSACAYAIALVGGAEFDVPLPSKMLMAGR